MSAESDSHLIDLSIQSGKTFASVVRPRPSGSTWSHLEDFNVGYSSGGAVRSVRFEFLQLNMLTMPSSYLYLALCA